MALTYNSLVTTTLEKRLKGLGDTVFLNRAFVRWLLEKGRVKTFDGGRYINVPLVHAENSTFQTYSGSDTLNIGVNEEFTMAEYNWRQASIAVTMTGIEEAKNNGDSAVIDWLDAKVENAKETALAEFNRMFLTSDGTGNGGKDWAGLPALVVSGGTVGGIATADAAGWDSLVTVKGTPGTGPGAAVTLEDLFLRHRKTSRGGKTVDFCMTTEELLTALEAATHPQARYTNHKMAELGFDNIKLKTATVFADEDLVQHPTIGGSFYFLTSGAIWIAKHSEKWMKQRKFIEPIDKDTRTSLILSYGNLCTSSRRNLSAFTQVTDITAS